MRRQGFALIVLLWVIAGAACAAREVAPATVAPPGPTNQPSATARPPATATASPTARPTATRRPTVTPTPTATPFATPVPLSAHDWDAGPVLFRYDSGFCYDICGDFSPYPRLILYSDGRLVRSYYTPGDFQMHVEQSQLAEEEMCALLDTFEATGLLAYDPAAFYEADEAFPRLRYGAFLDVTAWERASIDLGVVNDYRPGGLLEAEVGLDAPALLAYHLIERLIEGDGEAPFAPLELAVAVRTLAAEDDPFVCCFAGEGGLWPVTDVRLADLAARGVPNEYDARQVYTTVSGPAVEQLMAAFGDNPFSEYTRISFEEDGRRYVVSIRALLPYESLAGLGGPSDTSAIPGPDVTATHTMLSCSPEDGVVEFYADVVEAAARDAGILAVKRRPTPLPVETAPPSPKDIFEP